MDHIEAFRSAMRAAGIEPPPEIVADGKLKRFTVPGDRAKSENGFYVLHADEPIAGSFGSWKLGINETWCFQTGGTMSPEEKAKFAAKMAEARRQQEEERKRVHAECRAWCADAWAKAKEATNSNPYLQRKGVNAYGLRVLKDSLLVPVKDIGGTLHGLQFISPDGSKKFKTGTNKHGHFCTIGKAKGDTVVIAEGYATASSIHQATGHCVLVAFDSGNLKPVCEVVRAKRPGIKIIIAADNDQFSDGNPGLTKGTTAARAVGGFLAVPVFLDTSEKPTDFNDLHRLEGLDRVREIIEGAAPVVSVDLPDGAPKAEVAKEEVRQEGEEGAAGGWQEPLHFCTVETPDISAGLLPVWLGDYARAVADSTQTPPGLSVMFALATVAACLQRRFEVSPYGDDYVEPVSLWTVTALDPGNRKTAVRNAFTGVLSDWERDELRRMGPEIKKIKHRRDVALKTIDQLKAKAAKLAGSAECGDIFSQIDQTENEMPDELTAPRLWTDDITPERLQALLMEHGERMALLSDEGGIFEVMAGLYSSGRANLNVFLQGHAGAAVRVDRQGRSVTLQRPALTFGLTVQPDVISQLAQGNKARFRGNGTLARFLYCLPKSTIGGRDVTRRAPVPESVKAAYVAGIKGLLAIGPEHDEKGQERPRILTLSGDALPAWQAFSQYIEDNQGPKGEFFHFQDWTSKLPGAALRVAGLLHVVEHGAEVSAIGMGAMERALNLCELLIEHARAAFDLMADDESLDDAKAVLAWIKAKGQGEFRKNDVYKENRRFRTGGRLDKALAILTERNMISEPCKRKTGGRSLILYAVNPELLK